MIWNVHFIYVLNIYQTATQEDFQENSYARARKNQMISNSDMSLVSNNKWFET